MAQFALIVAWLGGMVLLAAVPVGLMYLAERRKHAAYTRVPVRDCTALLTEARLPRRVAVYGRTVPGPSGSLVAPASGRSCVWYDALVEMVAEEGSDTTVVRLTSPDPIGLADRTGTVGIAASLLNRELADPTERRPEVVRQTVEEQVVYDGSPGWLHGSALVALRRRGYASDTDLQLPRGEVTYRVSERVVDAGRWVYALGRPMRRDGRVVLRRRWIGVSGVSGRSSKAVRAGSANELTTTLSMLRFTLVCGTLLAGVGFGLWYLAR